MTTTENKALDGVRVLDFSRFAAGPFCCAQMADMGAEVIRVEDPGGAIDRRLGLLDTKGESLAFKATARNKKGITLNLTSPKAEEILNALVKVGDVVIHNSLPGTRVANILSYPRLKEINQNIIVGAISGYGQSGPNAGRPSLDPVAQAKSGLMWVGGFPGNPPVRAGSMFLDFSAGAILAFSIVTALYHRQMTGTGQIIDIALFDVAISSLQLIPAVALYKIYGEVRQQVGNYGFSAYLDCCRAKDGWVYLCPFGEIQWQKFTTLLGREDMAFDPKFSNDMVRFENRGAIHEIVEKWMEGKTVDEVVRLLEKTGVVVSRVNTVPEMMEEPEIKTREMIIDLEHPGIGKVPVPGVIPKFSETPGEVRTPAPKAGENNMEIYGDLLGFSRYEIGQLLKEGII